MSLEMQFSTDLAQMNTQPQRIKVDDAARTNDNRGISWCPDSCQGKLLDLVSLTNLFGMRYPRLRHICSFAYFLEYFQLFLVDNVFEEYQEFSSIKSPTFVFCLAFAWFFANFSLALLRKVFLIKKVCSVIWLWYNNNMWNYSCLFLNLFIFKTKIYL